MASSVSSERAFSSAGITISKRRNRLRKDIIEALQCLKCMYHNDLIFRDVITASEEVKDMEQDPLLDMPVDNDTDIMEEDIGWVDMVIDDESDT
jgi:hypothetical protein